ncbi:MAG: anaerobic ribonucleoside-triphosphate reductase activating protein [Muribaculaceae bacterium]|nr:anaerobic ribonucleoside-triphosphate reductase activating protein [Muribaculaceae bacterium]
MRVIRILEGTSVDGPGLRTAIYFAGCGHHCPACHNEHTWDFRAGEDMTVEQVLKVVRYNGFPVTFTGGDPIYQAAEIIPLAKAIKEELHLNIWCYTGYTHEELIEMHNDDVDTLLSYVDTIVDGPYIDALRDTSLLFRGSSNQRIIDLHNPD